MASINTGTVGALWLVGGVSLTQLLRDWLDRHWAHLGFSQFPYSVHMGNCLARHLKGSVSVGNLSCRFPESERSPVNSGGSMPLPGLHSSHGSLCWMESNPNSRSEV